MNDTPDVRLLRQRLGRLVQRLIYARFESARDIWRMQIQLLELQRQVQREITRAKKTPDSDEVLGDLRSLRWHARRLGDAIAWVLLRCDERVLESLAKNTRVPIGQDDHGSRGMVALAEALAGNHGFGFPLLHDITDVLRIGDVTFIGLNPDDPPQTVEFKTKHLGREPGPDGRDFDKYEVRFWSTQGGLPRGLPIAQRTTDAPVATNVPRPSPREERQLKRMGLAYRRQRAGHGEVLDVEDTPTISIETNPSSNDHMAQLARAVRRARRSGVAYEQAGPAMLVVALYDADGIGASAVDRLADAPGGVLESGILLDPDPRGWNSLVVLSVVDDQVRSQAQLYLPYHLLPIPRTAVMDLLHERLHLLVVVNPGRIAEALEDAGFDVEVNDNLHPLDDRAISVTSVVEHKGERYRVRLGGIRSFVERMIFELRALDYVVDNALAMRDAITYGIDHRLAETA